MYPFRSSPQSCGRWPGGETGRRTGLKILGPDKGRTGSIPVLANDLVRFLAIPEGLSVGRNPKCHLKCHLLPAKLLQLHGLRLNDASVLTPERTQKGHLQLRDFRHRQETDFFACVIISSHFMAARLSNRFLNRLKARFCEHTADSSCLRTERLG